MIAFTLILTKKSTYSKGQFGNTVTFKIIVVSCAVKIINYKENQLNVWQILFLEV